MLKWEQSLIIVILIFFRVLGVIIATPVLGDRAIPAQAKIGLALGIAMLVFPIIPIEGINQAPTLNLYALILLVAKETLIGITIGLVILFMFIGVQLAGSIMGFQMGMWLADIFDPHYGIETPVLAHFHYLLAAMLFISVNGHLVVLNGVRESFAIVPLGEVRISEAMLYEVLRLGGNIFRVGFEIGAPIIGILLFVSLAMGLVARAVPEFNVLIEGVPLKILIGLLFLGVCMPYIGNAILKIYTNLGPNILKLFKLMNL